MSIKTPWTAAELVKFAKLHNLFSDIHAPSRERENAARRLEKMLRAHGCNTDPSHNNPDLNEVLKQATEALEEADRARSARNAAPPPMPPAVPQQPPPGAPSDAEQLFHTICCNATCISAALNIRSRWRSG